MMQIARIEASLYLGKPKLVLALLVVALIPALYVVIYLSSVWNPAANTASLAVGLVNLDRQLDYRGYVFNVGAEVRAKLKNSALFGYRDLTDAEEARRLVREGKLAFALIIPSDFSSNAIPGAEAGAGKLEIYVSEGNSYQSATLARQFAVTLGHEVNESLNEQRWALVLSNALGSRHGLERLRQAVEQVRSGAHDLAVATAQASSGSVVLRGGQNRLHQNLGHLAAGLTELGNGLRILEEKQPPSTELNRLKQGSESLLAGQSELGRGLVELRNGAQRLQEGVTVFHEEAKGSLLVSDRLTEGLGQLSEGLNSLDSGLQRALTVQFKLLEGIDRLNGGVGSLSTGLSDMGTGIRSLVGHWPRDAEMEKLTQASRSLHGGTTELMEGLKKIEAGARHVSGGLDLLAHSLPVSTQPLEGSPKGLANSVRPSIEVVAPVQNNGSSFAPNIIPAALWLGAGIAAFLIYVRQQPQAARHFPPPVQMLGKIFFPACIVCLQALLVFFTVLVLLQIHVAHLGVFALTLAISSLTFITIVFALTRLLGDAGKALALLFLAVQLSSSGGIIPVELSGPVFMDISPWLPLTWVVRAIKASMFHAYEGAWLAPLLYVALAGVLAAVMACYLGRWRYVETADMQPPLDL